jgi:FeS assembly protein IscX
MKWHEQDEIVEALETNHPDKDVLTINSEVIQDYLSELMDFEDDPERCEPEYLEEIHQAWIKYREDNY